MIYPVPYFKIRNWAKGSFDGGSPRMGMPISGYQYGRATRALAWLRCGAAAAYDAGGANFFSLDDGIGHHKVFQYKAGPPVTIPGAVLIDLTPLTTAATVATATQNAIASVFAFPTTSPTPAGNLAIFPFVNPAITSDLLLEGLMPGARPTMDVAGLAGVVGIGAFGFLGGGGSLLSGRTSATGFIGAIAGVDITEGATFTLDDGTLAPVTFFFDKPGGAAPGPGEVGVSITDAMTAGDVAVAIMTAINAAGPPPAGPPAGFRIRAVNPIGTFAPPISPFLGLINIVPGAAGGSYLSPLFATETVVNAGFIVIGMAGGQDGSVMAPLRWGLSRAGVPSMLGTQPPQGG